MRLLLATHNEHKRRELGRLLPDHEIVLLPDAVQLPPEDGETFAENALGKARAAAAATGEVTIADDSGIEAAALGGAPGVRSARYAGEHATDASRTSTSCCARRRRAARWRTCARSPTWTPPRGSSGCSRSAAPVASPPQPRGEGGFGYDPAFLPDDGPPDLTMAELTAEQKDAISHRGRAARALAGWVSRQARRSV